ncbi:MAG: hypothetical protein MI824_16245 [Hyphomicrobiales bacterium]|nr:hypothetical protein [Hyphomicrobiales bacterium]
MPMRPGAGVSATSRNEDLDAEISSLTIKWPTRIAEADDGARRNGLRYLRLGIAGRNRPGLFLTMRRMPSLPERARRLPAVSKTICREGISKRLKIKEIPNREATFSMGMAKLFRRTLQE